MKRVLVTGVAGFLGSHLADKFLEMNLDVIGIDNLIGGYREIVSEKVRFHEVDLGNLNLISPYFKNVDLVVHSACTAYEGLSVFSPGLVTQNTSQITTNVLSASAQAGVKKFVFMSSMARYGTQKEIPFREEMTPKPQDPYGIAKLASELMVRNICETHGMEYVILVPHNIIGPRQKYDDPYRNVVSIMINLMLQKRNPIIYGDGNQKRTFSDIDDCIYCLDKLITDPKVVSQVVNIGPDEEFITINELYHLLCNKLKFNLEPKYLENRPNEVKEATCSADKARKILGYKTNISLNKSLDKIIDYIQKKGPKNFQYNYPLEINNENLDRKNNRHEDETKTHGQRQITLGCFERNGRCHHPCEAVDIAAHNHNGPHFANGPAKASQGGGHQGAPPIPNERCNSLAMGGVQGNQQIMVVGPKLAHGLVGD